MGHNAAKDFKKKYEVDRVNSRVLQSIIETQGYTFIEFNGIADTEDVNTLIDLLDIRQNIQSSKCFIYQDELHRLLFINEGLSEDERLIVLAHEEGHIWHKHMLSNSSTFENVTQEYEANEFAHYLLKDTTAERKRKRILIGVGAACCVLCFVAFFRIRYNAATYTNNLYITEDGLKYHRKDCIYIRGRKNVRRLRIDEFESGEYTACEVCFPDEQGDEAEEPIT